MAARALCEMLLVPNGAVHLPTEAKRLRMLPRWQHLEVRTNRAWHRLKSAQINASAPDVEIEM
jgi:hypothetical protein